MSKNPITFACSHTLPFTAAVISNEIINFSRWPEFGGYGMVPGIRSAKLETQPANLSDLKGSRIQVQNTDGSRHIEEILVWQTGEHVMMKLCEFTAPLSNLATYFIEDWTFAPSEGGTKVTRAFEMHAKSAATRPMLWLISLLFRRAVAHHLVLMARA